MRFPGRVAEVSGRLRIKRAVPLIYRSRSSGIRRSEGISSSLGAVVYLLAHLLVAHKDEVSFRRAPLEARYITESVRACFGLEHMSSADGPGL